MRVNELPIVPATNVCLMCFVCMVGGAASRGDYWFLHPDDELNCCGQPMQLVKRVVSYAPITPEEAETLKEVNTHEQ